MTPDDVIHRFWFGAGMCGCGDPVEVLRMVRDELGRLDTRPGDGSRQPAPEGRDWRLLGYLLDAWGLTEHGTSLAWPWLTDEGRDLLAALHSVGSLAAALDDGGMAPFDADPDGVERVELPNGYARAYIWTRPDGKRLVLDPKEVTVVLPLEDDRD